MFPRPAAFDGYPPFTPPALAVLIHGYLVWFTFLAWWPAGVAREDLAEVAGLLRFFGLIDALLAAWLLIDLLRWFASARPRPKVPLVLDFFALLDVGIIQLLLATIGSL